MGQFIVECMLSGQCANLHCFISVIVSGSVRCHLPHVDWSYHRAWPRNISHHDNYNFAM
jgi:hypothetical protein